MAGQLLPTGVALPQTATRDWDEQLLAPNWRHCWRPQSLSQLLSASQSASVLSTCFLFRCWRNYSRKKTDATSCAEKDDDAVKEKIANLCFVVSALQGRRERGKGEVRQQGVRRVAAVALCAGVIYF